MISPLRTRATATAKEVLPEAVGPVIVIRRGLFVEEEFATLLVEIVVAEAGQAGAVDDKLIIDTFDDDDLGIFEMALTDLDIFEDNGRLVEDITFGVEGVVAVGEVVLVDTALIEEVHSLFPSDSDRFGETFIDKHRHSRAVDDAFYFALGRMDHSDIEDILIVDDFGFGDDGVDRFVDEVDNLAVLGLLDQGGSRVHIVDKSTGDKIGAEDEEFDTAVELVGHLLIVALRKA